jgi:hypothetical protein
MGLSTFNFSTRNSTVPLHDNSCKFTLFFLSVAQQPKSGLDSFVLKFQYHTQTHAVRLLSTSDQLLADTLAVRRFHPFYRPRRPLGRVEV